MTGRAVVTPGTPLLRSAAMKLPYAHRQALAFVGACCMFGAMVGALVAAARGGLR